jgi:hypothetical protein
MKAFLLSTFAAVALCRSVAAGQEFENQITNDMQDIGNESIDIIRHSCRGPKLYDSFAGIPGNQEDDIRCESISVSVLECVILADSAGSYLAQVDDGKATFDDIKQSMDNSRGNDVATSSALVLAKQAPPGTNPSQFIKTVFAKCVGIIDHK